MDTAERVQWIFRETLSIEVPSPTTDIIGSGLLDSLALVTLLFELESQFAITIEPESLDLERLRTVAQIAALVEDLVAPPVRTPAGDPAHPRT